MRETACRASAPGVSPVRRRQIDYIILVAQPRDVAPLPGLSARQILADLPASRVIRSYTSEVVPRGRPKWTTEIPVEDALNVRLGLPAPRDLLRRRVE